MAWSIERLETCTSTQDEAKRRARDGAPDGTVVVAERMEQGRGTHGRPWHAPEGGLYASIVLRDLQDPHLLTLALGNAVADALEVAGAEPRLKWVNDVRVDGRKVAGVLVEGESTGDRLDFLVAGIGINVNGSSAQWPDLHDKAVTLEDVLGAESCIPDLEAVVLEQVAAWLDKVRAGDGKAVLEAWRRRDDLEGRAVDFDPAGDDHPRLQGTARGIDDQGRLLLEAEGQVQAFAAGKVLD